MRQDLPLLFYEITEMELRWMAREPQIIEYQ
jgi:hypothetical protein